MVIMEAGSGKSVGRQAKEENAAVQESFYYWFVPDSTVLMLFVFKKNERSDITKTQLKVLRTIVAKELK